MYVRADISILKWESEFFKQLIAELNFVNNSEIVSINRLNQFNIVQVKIDSFKTATINKLEKIGFVFVEGEINFLLKTNFKNYYLSTILSEIDNIDIAKQSDIHLLCKSARIVFKNSRYRYPWYSNYDSGRFYSLWVKKAVLNTFDDVCLLLKNKFGIILGFVSLRNINEDVAQIGILAKIPGVLGSNIGGKLMSLAFDWCIKHNKKQLNISTQISNIAAINLYLNSGALVKSIKYWLYRGCNDPI